MNPFAAHSFKLLVFMLLACVPVQVRAGLPVFDFTGAANEQGWTAAHDVAEFKPSREGLVARISGGDPFIYGPRGDYSGSGQLIFTANLRSPMAGWGQVFFSPEHASEKQSVHFRVREGWNHVCAPLPPMGAGWRLRVDFPATSGECVLARAGVEEAGARGVARVKADGDLHRTLHPAQG
ncbi:MAG: hypothetical protein ABMA01_15200, partial [Chthoniobacteraceae bacterium]